MRSLAAASMAFQPGIWWVAEGFRRPGYSVYVEPGVSWTRGQNTFNLFTPVMVAVNRQKNIYDDRFGSHGPAVFADFLIITSFSRKF